MTGRVFIAGGAGFIGSHLVDFYLARQYQVTAMDDLSTGKLSNVEGNLKNKNYNFIHDNIITSNKLAQELELSDIVINMAAKVGVFNVIDHPMDTLVTNVRILERILEQISKLNKKPLLLTASTSEVYGSSDNAMDEYHPIFIQSTAKGHASYPVSKLYNEINSLAFHKDCGIPTIVVRIFNTTGSRQRSRYGMVMPRFINQALEQKPLTIFGDGTQTRSFCHVRHLCEQLYALCNNADSIGKIVNVGNRQDISILQLAKLVTNITGSSSEIVYKSFYEAYGNEHLQIMHRKPDLSLVERITGIDCSWEISEVVKEMVKASTK